MPTWIDYAVIIAAVALAVGFLVRRHNRAKKGEASPCAGCTGCDAARTGDAPEDGECPLSAKLFEDR